MKAELFVVDINYHKEIAEISLPNIERYANSIGAKFTRITERKFPDMHVSYEKLQVYELGKDNDWNISVDADILLGIAMYNVINMVPNDGNHIGCWEGFSWPNLYNGRGIDVGIAGNFLVIPKACMEVCKPLNADENYKKYCERPGYVVEYCLSLNRQKLGFKLAGLELPGVRDIMLKHLNVTTGKVEIENAVQEAKRFLNNN